MTESNYEASRYSVITSSQLSQKIIDSVQKKKQGSQQNVSQRPWDLVHYDHQKGAKL